MTAVEINGRDLAQEIKDEMKVEVEELNRKGIYPKLTVVLVGDDPASKSYVKGKKKASAETGIESELIELPVSTTETELLSLLNGLNNDNSIHGILVQLPLPDHINEQKVIETISPKKDVDGFHPINIGHMMTGNDTFLPCTPHGIIAMLKSRNLQIESKHAVVIGRSNIVGKPVGQLLLNENATVTYCHSKTKNLQHYTKQADILIVAVGRPNVINQTHLKEGAIVIDVGVNRLEDGTLTGDVDFDSAKEIASYITPVPRGVGPMTITMLLKNTIKAAKGMTR
ncbi:bifunctional methylenetetrahydrofolate dehydrogenase/methenyltetrahydrofolate cyclohydrolase FolD [Virgibacillus halodenitrificans]|uniref:bifunctional methylenetetrahydrofolate dehydrogenase/methenyltetrahydrofolate cyclohydrolase FolD n=1 Tax=Virgibacillus halodenitrificans TaxID=1482 RepID=UPI001F340350|nr:bifunctional methylenetetrahydrofolate dehydrogenase/methenyltetrahydrofolate cyclohydrolase FolD [Virgibacillus halodenitrificans]MEC2158394.1 bifunctional methylenetetrahydrofolate dehydrogenase/methenyltetrahydrofolate cyclohydrolase FolD [Virgibacillus halodenitrificans]